MLTGLGMKPLVAERVLRRHAISYAIVQRSTERCTHLHAVAHGGPRAERERERGRVCVWPSAGGFLRQGPSPTTRRAAFWGFRYFSAANLTTNHTYFLPIFSTYYAGKPCDAAWCRSISQSHAHTYLTNCSCEHDKSCRFSLICYSICKKMHTMPLQPGNTGHMPCAHAIVHTTVNSTKSHRREATIVRTRPGEAWYMVWHPAACMPNQRMTK